MIEDLKIEMAKLAYNQPEIPTPQTVEEYSILCMEAHALRVNLARLERAIERYR